MRVLELNKSEIKKGDNVCIFIIYERMEIPKLTWDAINTIKSMGIKIFLVVNSRLSEEEKQKVRKTADISMFRNNTGKDIGGYKDAFLYLQESDDLEKINRLIFANDSIVYPKNYIKPIFADLVNKRASLVGYSHVQEIHYHVQSFLFSCDNSLINDKIFIQFWKKYLPIDRRRYMIHKGEVGITKAVIKTGKEIAILNELSDLLNQDLSIDQLIEITNSLPTRPVQNIAVMTNLINLDEKIAEVLSAALKDIELNVGSKNIEIICDDIQRRKKNLIKSFLLDLVAKIGFRNSTHWNTFIFLELNKPVIIKRDSFYRAGYDFDIFKYYLKKYLPKEADEIMFMMKSPASNHFKGMKRVMFDHGII